MVNKIFERAMFSFSIVFAFIGCIFLSILLHELSHYQDYHKYVDEEYICGFVWPTSLDFFKNITEQPAGYYEYSYDSHNKLISDEIDILDGKTEKRAYAITILILIFFLLAFATELIHRMNLHFEKLERERPPKFLPDLPDLGGAR